MSKVHDLVALSHAAWFSEDDVEKACVPLHDAVLEMGGADLSTSELVDVVRILIGVNKKTKISDALERIRVI